MTSLFWAKKESSRELTYVLEIGEGVSRLFIRARRTTTFNDLRIMPVLFAYWGDGLAILALNQALGAFSRYPGLANTTLLLWLLGFIILTMWVSWWVPKSSINNPAATIEIQILKPLFGLVSHRLDVKARDELFRLVVYCPRRRLTRALNNLGLSC